jgi:hypothetical protein
MRWREILIGAAFGLVIAIVGGIVVYYVTREKEHLIYTIDQPVAFETDTTHLTIQNIGIANAGDSSAKHVEIVIDASRSGTEIKEQSVTSSSGPASGIMVDEKLPITVSISLNSLIPKEQIKVALLLTSKPRETPVVSVKSDASLGTQESSLTDSQHRSENTLVASGFALIATLIGGFTVLLLTITTLGVSAQWRRSRAEINHRSDETRLRSSPPP